MATIYKGGLLQINQNSVRKQTNNINRVNKVKEPKIHFNCLFYIGQIIQHKKYPKIKYLLISQPVQSCVKRYGSKIKCWKMKLFSIRAGTLGGKIITRHLDYQLCRNYVAIESPEINMPSHLTTK